jgi:hypothetical protein
VVELRDLCREEVEGEWDVARRACAQCFELGNFRLPGRRLGITGMQWLELGWLKRVCERVSTKARVLPGRGRVVYGTRSLLFLPLLFEDSLESFLVWAII